MRLSTALSLAFLLAACVGASGDTIVDSDIESNTTWTPAGSPYIVTERPLQVTNGSTLTIQPGVEVRFVDLAWLQTDTPEGGTIVAVGAPGDSILFTSDSPSPFPAIWLGLNPVESPSSEFRYCVFRYALYGIYIEEPIEDIENCAFRDCSYGIWCGNASPDISECTFWGCTYAILCSGDMSTPRIWHCNFGTDSAWNIFCAAYTSDAIIDATLNWWGTTNEGDIQDGIWDSNDNPPPYATVIYEPWLTEVPVEDSSWGRVKAIFRD